MCAEHCSTHAPTSLRPFRVMPGGKATVVFHDGVSDRQCGHSPTGSQANQRPQQRRGCLNSQWHSVLRLRYPQLQSRDEQIVSDLSLVSQTCEREHRCGVSAYDQRSNEMAGLSMSGAKIYRRRFSSDLSRSFVPQEYVQARALGSVSCKGSAHCLYGSQKRNGVLHNSMCLAAAWLSNLASPSMRLNATRRWESLISARAHHVLYRFNVREENS